MSGEVNWEWSSGFVPTLVDGAGVFQRGWDSDLHPANGNVLTMFLVAKRPFD